MTSSAIQKEIETLSQLLNEFDDPMEKYELIMDLGNELPTLDEQYCTDENRILGCQSNLWVKNFGTDCIDLKATSDAFIVRGMAQMILKVFNGKTKEEVLATNPDVLQALGISGLLTAGRQNGVGNLINKVYMYARQ